MKPRIIPLSWIALFGALAISLTFAQEPGARPGPEDRTSAIRGCFGTYAGVSRQKDRRVDVARLVKELAELKADSYNWLIHDRATDWEDLKLFLPQARTNHIRVWVTLVPPSESPPNNKMFSEPFRLDYERWAVEIAKLSVAEKNLVAWSIDDFTHNLKFYTPEKLRGIVAGARAINPHLAFVPCCYFSGIRPKFIAECRDSLDGILFPYRSESGKIGLTDASLVAAEVEKIRALVGPSLPVIVDVYASRHSSLGDSTPEYVREVMTAARQSADGVMIYCHQNPIAQAEKFGVIKELFGAWSTGKSAEASPAQPQQ